MYNYNHDIYYIFCFCFITHEEKFVLLMQTMQRRSIDFLVVLWVFFARFSGFNKGHFNKCKREGG